MAADNAVFSHIYTLNAEHRLTGLNPKVTRNRWSRASVSSVTTIKILNMKANNYHVGLLKIHLANFVKFTISKDYIV